MQSAGLQSDLRHRDAELKTLTQDLAVRDTEVKLLRGRLEGVLDDLKGSKVEMEKLQKECHREAINVAQLEGARTGKTGGNLQTS